jgi:hypothetical protein
MWQKLILSTLTVVLGAGASFAQNWRRYPPPRPYPHRPEYSRDYRDRDDYYRRDDARYRSRDDYRHAFVYDANGGGSFEEQGRGLWVENTRNGQFYYREARRTPRMIELYDNDRNLYVRLFDNMSYWLSDTTNGWAALYAGGWE